MAFSNAFAGDLNFGTSTTTSATAGSSQFNFVLGNDAFGTAANTDTWTGSATTDLQIDTFQQPVTDWSYRFRLNQEDATTNTWTAGDFNTGTFEISGLSSLKF